MLGGVSVNGDELRELVTGQVLADRTKARGDLDHQCGALRFACPLARWDLVVVVILSDVIGASSCVPCPFHRIPRQRGERDSLAAKEAAEARLPVA